jgi:glycosyltransferase involved in cell wall biosynthesis
MELMTIDRPKVSVCMAAFQGERYIAAQLRSILVQLADGDEVIVLDDHSSDRTCDEVRSLGDARIHLVERRTNQGVARSFEQSLLHASGDVIFLSDQDDLWISTKITTVLKAFKENPNVMLVVTDAALIDDDGECVGVSYYRSRGPFSSGFFSNLVRCKYLGCTMAFRSSLLAKALPFPKGYDILHDIWLGTVNSITRGATLYLDEALVLYRRHSAAVTSGKLSRLRQIRIRADLVQAVVKFWLGLQFSQRR